MAKIVFIFFILSNSQDLSPWFGDNKNPPIQPLIQPPPTYDLDAFILADSIPGTPRPLISPTVTLNFERFISSLI